MGRRKPTVSKEKEEMSPQKSPSIDVLNERIEQLLKNDQEINRKIEKVEDAISVGFKSVDNGFKEINKELASEYVTQRDLLPIKAIVYGLVSLILTGFVVTLLYVVWPKG